MCRFKMRPTRQLALAFRTWGGRREGAGRKPAPGRRAMPHQRRPPHDSHRPVHVTMRAARGLPSLRRAVPFTALRDALAASSGPAFRVLHFSVQADHLHLVVEADEPTGLSRGIQGLAIRAARAINRELGRHGRVWGDRFHAHALKTPREVRNALVYVLNNLRKHLPAARGIDPLSSAAWFTGWKESVAASPSRSPVARAHTWLASVGWRRRHGRIGLAEAPRATR
jgi:putative transposase